MFLSTTTEVGEWIKLITLILGLVGAIAALIPTIIKLGKALKEIAKNKDYLKLRKVAMAAMAKAQETTLSGAEKKQVVLDAVSTAAKELGVDCDEEQLAKIAEDIDAIKEWFKDFTAADTKQKKLAKKEAREAAKAEEAK